MNRSLSFSLRSLVITLFLTPILAFGQAPADPNQAAVAASDLFNQGKFTEAAAAFELFLKDNPGSSIEADVQTRLAAAYLNGGNPDKAIEILTKISTAEKIPPEVAEWAASLLPDAYTAKAAAMKPDDSGRDAALRDAIKAYDNFMAKYPQSKDSLEAILYGRAVANFQIEDYAEAGKTFLTLLSRFPKGDQTEEAQYLLAYCYSNEASKVLRGKPTDEEKAAAILKLAEAERILAQIVERKTDLALMNDALFQLGETYYMHSAAVPPEQKPPLLQKAKEAFGLVQPKEPIINAQTARIDAVKSYINSVKVNPNLPAPQKAKEIGRLLKIQGRFEGKLAQIKTRDTPTLAAQLRMGEILFQDEQFDEVRVLFRYLEPMTTTDGEKKSLSFHIAMSYALQAVKGKGDSTLADRAVKAWEDFKAKYYEGDKASPTADNLPIMLGMVYLNKPNVDPEKAVKFIKEGISLYPNGRFLPQALAQLAEAYKLLGKTEDSIGVIKEVLDTNKDPGVVAPMKLSLAVMYRDSKKQEEAITTLREIIKDFPERDEAERASFILLEILAPTDMAGAATQGRSFADKYPKSELAPSALRIRGLALRSTTPPDPAGATAAFREIIEKYPESSESTPAYFYMAAIQNDQKKYPEAIAVLKEFTEKRSTNPRVGDAYLQIGSIQSSKLSDPVAATATYNELVEKHPDSPKAARAMLESVEVNEAVLKKLGKYNGITDPAKKEQWEKTVAAITAASEDLIAKYPDSDEVAYALNSIVEAQKALIGAQKMTLEEQSKFFDSMREKNNSNVGLRSKISFKYAGSIASSDPNKAKVVMKSIYDPSLKYSRFELELYATLLSKAGEFDEAMAVYKKMMADYPPVGTDPSKWPKDVQDAQLGGLVGQAKVYFAKNDNANVDKLLAEFQNIQKDIKTPSSKLADANLLLLERAYKEGKDDEALKIAVDLAKNATAAPEVKARAMFVASEIYEKQGKIGPAADNYLKIAGFYGSVTDIASEAMWRGAQLLEKMNEAEKDPEAKKLRLASARKAYNLILENYGATPWADKARERLAVMPK